MNALSMYELHSESQALRLSGPLTEALLTDRDGVLGLIERSLAPFRFTVETAPGGVRLDGDDVAVPLASKILQAVDAAGPAQSGPDIDAIAKKIHGIVERELRHDLAFRLTGLAHPVRPMSLSQVAFMRELLSRRRAMILGVGPTGTGKTHLAIAAGLNQLALEHIGHMIVTRPHVVMEGEIATPASRQEIEYDEQFAVFEDVLRDLVGYREFHTLIEQKKLEIMPLGRMRGRTFNDCYIVIDEAQNMSLQKMRMAVTRLGQHARMVITGDPAQVHLPGGQISGLSHLLEMIEEANIATVFRFEDQQIVRNRIVARLEELYAFHTPAGDAFVA